MGENGSAPLQENFSYAELCYICNGPDWQISELPVIVLGLFVARFGHMQQVGRPVCLRTRSSILRFESY
jgi:hypothetical protein